MMFGMELFFGPPLPIFLPLFLRLAVVWSFYFHDLLRPRLPLSLHLFFPLCFDIYFFAFLRFLSLRRADLNLLMTVLSRRPNHYHSSRKNCRSHQHHPNIITPSSSSPPSNLSPSRVPSISVGIPSGLQSPCEESPLWEPVAVLYSRFPRNVIEVGVV